ncbi:MAG TPA: FAD-dependent monooxygenase [Pseudonocardia sp.]|nr:FAD-dependent monooxygenase [Pseudonocardia sp.]
MAAVRRVVSIGGGPGGLLAATLIKQSDPATEVVVLDRDPADAAYGFGVVFSASALSKLNEAVPWLHDDLSRAGRHWEHIELRLRGDRARLGGNGFTAVGRTALLRSLRHHAEAAGVRVRHETEVTDPRDVDADLVLGADGVSSLVRTTFAEHFRPDARTAQAHFVWFGAYADFAGLTFLFERTEHGWFAVHGYPYDEDGRCTFLVETDPHSWRSAGATDGLPPGPGHTDDVARRFCAQVFSDHLLRPELLGNGSVWRNFVTMRTASWSHDRYVLLGDAAHTAHFSVGSGTTMALGDAIALASALRDIESAGDLPGALRHYEAARRPSVERLQAAALPSMGWWENFRRYVELPMPQFAMHFLDRSGRITHDRAARQDPGFVAGLDRWFSGGSGVDAVLGTPFTADGWSTPGRTVTLAPEVALGVSALRPLVLRGTELLTAVGDPRAGDVSALLVDRVRGQRDVDDRVDGAVRSGAKVVAVRAGAPDEDARLAQINISERLRIEHRIPTALVEPAPDREHAAQLVLSGRADLVAVPASSP